MRRAQGEGASRPLSGEEERGRDAPSLSLTPKERQIHDDGLVSVLKQIHDELDDAVLEAYGWTDLLEAESARDGQATLPLADRLACGDDALEEAILERLVALNHERAEEEKRGKIRYLRPEFQDPDYGKATQAELVGPAASQAGSAPPATAKKKAAAKAKKQPWPKSLPDQITAIRDLLATAESPLTEKQIATHFTRANKSRLSEVLETLVSLGHAAESQTGFTTT